MRHFISFVLCLALLPSVASARALHLDAQKGQDAHDGLSKETAWRTLQHAADSVQPGDTVLVAPGVYFGPVALKAKGTAEQPILFRADALAENNVVVTDAAPLIRAGEVKWTVEDAKLGLYSAPYAGEWPARMLYSGTDLFPYMDVAHLRTFTGGNGKPGPAHGYTLDAAAKKLYVRLHASGRYGSPDPNKHVMAVAPGTGDQFDGTFIAKPSHYCFGVLGAGPAYVTLDGFTFETPGVAGVYVEASRVTVRRCWFRGCRTGVAGNYTDKPPLMPTAEDAYSRDYITMYLDPEAQARSAGDIRIEYCDFTLFPCFEDAADSIREYGATGMARKTERRGGGALPTQQLTYEVGIAARIARNWVIRRNFVHSFFDGLSCHALSASQGLLVEENIFQGAVDNGLETEDHAQDMHIVRNAFVDNFMPFSYQPLRGTPWPGPIYFTQNVIVSTPEYKDLWEKYKGRVAFKMNAFYWKPEWLPYMAGNKPGTPQRIPEPGMLAVNNTIFLAGGTLGIRNNILNQFYANNIFVASHPDARAIPSQLRNNAVAPAASGEPGPGKIAAGDGGLVLPDVAALKLDENLRPAAGSPLLGKVIPVPEAGVKLSDIGAVQAGDTWYPLSVGPLAARD